jgi:hypothetical protein
VETTGPRHRSKKVLNSAWRDWLRSSSDTSAPVSSSSSPAILEGLDDVLPVPLGQAGHAGFEGTQKGTDAVRRARGRTGRRLKERAERHAHDLGAPALHRAETPLAADAEPGGMSRIVGCCT